MVQCFTNFKVTSVSAGKDLLEMRQKVADTEQGSNYRVKYGLQVTFYLPKYCKKVPIYCIKIQVKSWFVAINTSTEK